MTRMPVDPTRQVLTHAQSERRRSVLSAARALATKGGYEAVTITAVSARAGVSRSTLYHYFGSKEGLLGELTLVETAELSATMESSPLLGSSTEERVAGVLERVVDWALRKPSLFEALVSTWTSPDVVSPGGQQNFNATRLDHFSALFGQEGLAIKPEVASLLEHVMFSCLVRLNRGLSTRDEAVDDLRLAAKLLLR